MIKSLVIVITICFSLVNTIDVPVTTGSFNAQFTLTKATGTGSTGSGISFDLTNGAGNFTILKQNFDAIAYTYQLWETYDLLLIDLIGISTDSSNVGIIYLYASPSTHEISSLYYESFTQKMAAASATGSVQFSGSASNINVYFPTLNKLPNTVSTNFKISGAKIELKPGSTGWAVVNGVNDTFIVFSTVNCATCEQQSKPKLGGGWYELHSLFVNEQGNRACFGILYLMIGENSSVILDYGLCFGGSIQVASESYTAQWSGSL